MPSYGKMAEVTYKLGNSDDFYGNFVMQIIMTNITT